MRKTRLLIQLKLQKGTAKKSGGNVKLVDMNGRLLLLRERAKTVAVVMCVRKANEGKLSHANAWMSEAR